MTPRSPTIELLRGLRLTFGVVAAARLAAPTISRATPIDLIDDVFSNASAVLNAIPKSITGSPLTLIEYIIKIINGAYDSKRLGVADFIDNKQNANRIFVNNLSFGTDPLRASKQGAAAFPSPSTPPRLASPWGPEPATLTLLGVALGISVQQPPQQARSEAPQPTAVRVAKKRSACIHLGDDMGASGD